MLDEATAKQFAKWGKTPPTTEPHGTPEEIAKNMTPLQPKNWRVEGNKLIAQTEMGELVQFIPTDMIMTGLDDECRPILKKVIL